jgi:site-specific DNA-methyltransferase (adenine-specific)
MSKDTPQIILGDCLAEMDKLIKQGVTVDAIITDPPYGTTACRWDSVIPFDEMWERLNKLIKPNGAIVLFGSEPFSSALRMSNIKNYKYDWYWKKGNSKVGHLNAKRRPLFNIEHISVFNCKTYNPQGLVAYGKITKRGHNGDNFGESNTENYQQYTNYPTHLLDYKKDNSKLHSTQKPVALMEYLIKTYTNEGETVLDFTCGSGTTGVACKNTDRKFIGIELDEQYFEIAKERMEHPNDK